MGDRFGVGTDDALKAVLSEENVFCSGPGGSGKTHTIKQIQALYPDSTLTVAPTGVAAINVDGMTAHRAFGLGMGISTEESVNEIKPKHRKLMRARALERIIIDEISMLRADKLWEVDQRLKICRRNNKPFGGLQAIFVGDFFQNLPIIGAEEQDLYYDYFNTELSFLSETWESLDLKPVILDKIYRQSSNHFANVLNCLRKGERLDDVLSYINDNCYKPVTDPSAITLTTTNADADKINKQNFNKLSTPVFEYHAKVKGDFTTRPVPEVLKLRVGLKVMTTANALAGPDGQMEYVNGSIGFIKELHDTSVVIELTDGSVVEVLAKVWQNQEYSPESYTDEKGKRAQRIKTSVRGEYKALPLRPAYAITIHKSQGLTLPSVNIDFGRGAFAAGMAYVALSRATNAGTLRMIRPLLKKDILIDPRVVDFYKRTFPGH